MEAIEVKNLSYKIGGKVLLKEVDFTLPKGKMLAIIGPNGAGKSTLLKLLCKELSPSSGDIYIHQQSLTKYTIAELATFRSVLSQQNSLSISLRVEELVMMGRYPHFAQKPMAQDYAIAALALQETGMATYARREYNTLSGGEQQRVQLARVIAQIYGQENGMLFLDEPTNGLDLLYQQHILQLARKMTMAGFTVISILHDINFACQYADYILLLKDGETVAFGSPQEVVTEKHIETAFQVTIKKIVDADFRHPLVFPVSPLLAKYQHARITKIE